MTKKLTQADFKLPALLIALSIIPLLGGIVRLTNVSTGSAPTPEDVRFLISPTPIIIHVISVALYSLLGAFQFSAGFRRRWPRWHRSAGKLLVVSGLLAAASGLWMTVFYRIPTTLQGPLLYGVRVAVACAMFAALVLGWASILRRDVPRHEAWMIRAYALGQGAATQVLVLGPWMLITGESGGITRDVLMTLSWLINVVVAEAIIAARYKGLSARRLLA